MNFTRRAIFPGMILSCLLMLLTISMIARPDVVWASGERACGISKNYPDSIQRWCSLIEEYAQQNNLDPELVAAVILQESGGQPDAYSKSGAVGLMQVMPRDGIAAGFICPNGPCFANRPPMGDLFDPEYNISYGCSMLSSLYNKYGNMRDALKAYGPRDVGHYYADKVIKIYQSY